MLSFEIFLCFILFSLQKSFTQYYVVKEANLEVALLILP